MLNNHKEMPGGYHIRISLTKPIHVPVPAESSSFKQTYFDTSSSRSTFTPTSLFQLLPAHPQKQSARRYTIHHPRLTQEELLGNNTSSDSSASQKDYRLGPLRIDWVDFDTMDLEGVKKSGVGKEKQTAQRG